jgi:hypothetical protein
MIDTARAVSSRLADLLRREHLAMADFLVALADFDQQKGWRDLGFAGLFPYLHRELGLSKAAAFYRKTAAELVQRFPEVVEPLRAGELCITSVVELAKVLTPENRAEVLPRFLRCSKQEAKAVAAELAPEPSPPRRAVVTPLPALPAAQAAPSVETTSQMVHPDEPLRPDAAPAPAAPPRPEAVPLTADLRRLHVTVSKGFLAKVEAARSALSHSHPGASMEEVLEAGLDLILARETRKRTLVARPRPAPPVAATPANPRHVPAHVRRAVYKRDAGRCSWPLDAGGACGSTLRLQLDHVVPVALGGASTVENLRVTCAFPDVSPRSRGESPARSIC